MGPCAGRGVDLGQWERAPSAPPLSPRMGRIGGDPAHMKASGMCDYRDEFESAVDYARSTLPQEAHSAASWSLHYGPSGGGARLSWDEALDELRAWAESVSDVVLFDLVPADCDEDSDEDSDEWREVECGRIDSADIIRAAVGRELASYL
jgi:hypothetical protein